MQYKRRRVPHSGNELSVQVPLVAVLAPQRARGVAMPLVKASQSCVASAAGTFLRYSKRALHS
jgi:hypothetical protein